MKLRAFLVLFLFSRILAAQIVLENNPTQIRWYRVRTPNFEVLFPEGFNLQAQRMANTLEHIREAESSSLGVAPRKISIILQNQSSISNGFVTMFPRHSEFYTMPSQNYNFLGTNDWLNMLASHEYRHVVQYQHARRGFNSALFYLFGYPTFSGMAHAAAPDWFWEGDAVVTETSLTPSGRGKIPNFSLLFRTNLLEGREFNYHKQYLRSFKHNIPNHYVLGYHMVSYLRKRTNDPDIWEKITARSWAVPFIPFAFSNAIKKETGLYVTDLYDEMAADLQKQWYRQIDSLKLTPFETLNTRPSTAYTDYLYPQPLPDGSVLVRKEGIGDIEQFVTIKDGKERPFFTPGYINDAGMLSAVEGRVVWNEFGFDPRWRVRNYSLVKAYDKKTRSVTVISDKRSRYGSAAFSPDGKFIVTVRSDIFYKHALVVLSYPEGNVLKVFPNPENHFYAMPRWSDNGQSIVTLKITPEGKTICRVNVSSGEEEELMPLSHENTGHPVLAGKYLFFNAPVAGIDNIHALDLESRERYQITSSKYGAYNPAVAADGTYLYYNEQTRDGMDVVRARLDPSRWKRYVPAVDSSYHHLVEQEARPTLLDSIPGEVYPVSRYNRWKNVVNPFSWGLFVENDLATVDVGLTSRDIMSTTNLSAGYTFDLNERTGFWRVGVSYQGLYPIIDLDFTRGKRSVDEGLATTTVVNGSDTTYVTRNAIFKWEEQNVSAGIRIPLILTHSRFSKSLVIQNRIGYTQVNDFRNDFLNDRIYPTLIRNDTIFQGVRFLEYVGNGKLLYNHFSLSASNLLKRSYRDIVSRWGQALAIRYFDTPYGGDFTGGLVSASGYLYFPGLMKHHGLWGQASFQRRLSTTDSDKAGDVYFFRNTVPIPRGQSLARFQNLYTASVNYTFPLWYPDIAVGPLLNVQRLRVNLFTDYAVGQHSYFRGVDNTYLSVGGELVFDFNIMRFLPRFDLGVRYSHGVSPATKNIEVVIGTFNF